MIREKLKLYQELTRSVGAALATRLVFGDSIGAIGHKEEEELKQDKTVEPSTKRCSQCHQYKPYAEYQKNKQAKDRHFSWCKQCHAKADKERDLWDAVKMRGEYPTVVSLDELIEREYRSAQ